MERMRTTAKPTKARKMDARFTAAEFHGDEVLGIRNLSKAYGEKPLFEGISLKVEGGERIALIGDNGTGKSTLIKMIADEVYPDSGRIRLGPQVKLAYLPQIIHFDHPDWNLVENMMAAKPGHLRPVCPGTGWRLTTSGVRTSSSRCPFFPAASRAACGCVC